MGGNARMRSSHPAYGGSSLWPASRLIRDAFASVTRMRYDYIEDRG